MADFHRWAKFEAGIYLMTSREKIEYFSSVGNVALFDSHHNTITAFTGSLGSD